MAGSNHPPFTSVFRAETAHRVTRNRPPVSCTACQRRKSRCDRQHPCSACTSRGLEEKCHFGPSPAPFATPHGNGAAAAPTGGGRQQEVQARLTQLEEIVKGLAAGGDNGSGERDVVMKDGKADVERTGEEQNRTLGQEDGLYVDRSEEEYQGATSWSAVVEGIHGIQTLLKDIDDSSSRHAAESQVPPPLPESILSAPATLSVRDIVEGLPSRQEADKLVAAYFSAKFVTVMYIHTHQFRRRYEEFWAQPKANCYLWVSCMFSILCIGKAITEIKGGSDSGRSDASKFTTGHYMALAERCYVAGEYSRAKPFSVEALLLHAHSRTFCHPDSDSFVWQYYGIAARLAQRQGLHRETDKLSHTVACAGGGRDGKGDGKITRGTPFQAEMRRRIWFAVSSHDLMHSFQNGLPSLIDDAVCDTLPPTNLTDDDFDEDTKELPPARPATDPSPQLVYICKAKLCVVLRKVLRHALSVTPCPYHETMDLHRALDKVHGELPACLRSRSIKSSAFTDPAYTIMHRLMLEILYLKTLCLLHRPYLSRAQRADAQYEFSRVVCREAAVKLLEIHNELDGEVRENGRLHEDRYMLGALTLHSFLVAAMVICVDLCEGSDMDRLRSQRIGLVQQAAAIWTSRSATSKDALHASRVLHSILRRLTAPCPATSDTQTPLTAPLTASPVSSSTITPSNALLFDSLGGSNSVSTVQSGYDPGLDKTGLGLWAGTDFDWASMDAFLREGTSSVGEIWDFGDPTAGAGL